MKNYNVFVYGTLRQGHGNHHLLRHSTFLGAGVTTEPYTMSVSGIPFVAKSAEHNINPLPVRGEMYEVDDATLRQLDFLEGHPRYYCREVCEIDLDAGERLEAWLYFCEGSRGRWVNSHGVHDYNKVK